MEETSIIVYFCPIPPHLEIYKMPKTHTRVMIIPEIIAITAPVTSVMSLIVSPASANNPTIISFHINAMINPKAAAIAVDMLIFTSFNLTILSLASPKLLLHISPLLLRFSVFHTYFLRYTTQQYLILILNLKWRKQTT